MTLFKQIALIVSVIFILLFFIVLWVSFSVIKESSKQSLYESAQNSATSISLTIDNVGGDIGAIKTVLNASFDNGNYERIVFIDGKGKVQYSQMKKYDDIDVPKWFVNFVKLDPVIARANLSSGWQVLGVLSVYGDLGVVYVQLYEIFLQLCLYLAAAYLSALWILYYIFKGLLHPLSRVKKQAQAITNNEFILNEKFSFTAEFNSVIKSMNAMVKKVEDIFNNATQALKQNKELLYVDEVTKLYNRRYFSLKANEYINDDTILSNGTMVALNIEHADVLNKLVGYKQTDEFFRKVASLMKQYFENEAQSFVSRLNGTEFIAIVPNKNSCDLRKMIGDFAQKLQNAFSALNTDQSEACLNIGFCDYGEEKTIGQMFAKIDNTLSNAKLAKCCEVVCLNSSDVAAIGKEQWRQTLQNAIDKDEFLLSYQNIEDSKQQKALFQIANFSLVIGKQTFSYTQFVAALVELRMLNRFFIYALKRVLLHVKSQKYTVLSIPLAVIYDKENLKEIQNIFENFSHQQRQNIVLEIPEDAFINNYDQSVSCVKVLKEYGANFGISHFTANSDDYGFLKELKPKYIKADKGFILDDAQNINLVNIIMNSLGIEMIVTGIENDNEIKALNNAGIYKILRKK